MAGPRFLLIFFVLLDYNFCSKKLMYVLVFLLFFFLSFVAGLPFLSYSDNRPHPRWTRIPGLLW